MTCLFTLNTLTDSVRFGATCGHVYYVPSRVGYFLYTMKHKDAGIDKRISEPVYPSDILSDTNLRMCRLSARGAWFECLLRMWRDKIDRISGSYESFGRLWGCSTEEAEMAIKELEEHNPCTVTECNGNVTLLSRRLERRLKSRAATAERVRKHREEAPSNSPVTVEKVLPSVSSSISSSISKDKSSCQIDWKTVVDKWNALGRRHTFPEIQRMTDKRKRSYQLRLKNWPDLWDVLERELPQFSDFHKEGHWFGFDWWVKSDTNFAKLAEGNYRSNTGPGPEPEYESRLGED